MTGGQPPIGFGLITVGDEMLSGNRTDAHLAYVKRALHRRGYDLRWYWILPDEADTLTTHLRFSLARPETVFVCGGIGATPDDLTRGCAAAAAGADLRRHPEAAALIEGRFGADAYPHRILMADLPDGSTLIPNPRNRIPGFRLRNHFFLPGFPEMAWPMTEWVLDQLFPQVDTALTERAVRVVGVPESSLVPLMRRLAAAYPQHKVFSLPHIGAAPYILLGLRGREGIEEAFKTLCSELDGEGLSYSEVVGS